MIAILQYFADQCNLEVESYLHTRKSFNHVDQLVQVGGGVGQTTCQGQQDNFKTLSQFNKNNRLKNEKICLIKVNKIP